MSTALTVLKGKGIVCDGIPCHVGVSADRQALIDKTLDAFGGSLQELDSSGRKL